MEKLINKWLSRQQSELIYRMCEAYKDTPIQSLRERSAKHLEAARKAHGADSFVNLGMAEGLWGVLEQVAEKWDCIEASFQYWFRGAFGYFIADDDELNDFESPIGFEDDLEVLNACLRLAGMDDLMLDPKDFDDA